MPRIFAGLLLLFVMVCPVYAELTRDQLPPDAANRISDEQLELINWMMFYYRHPKPDEFPKWLNRASAAGLLKDDERQFPFLGFEASIFMMNADKIPQWINFIDALTEHDRKNVLIALWLSDTKTGRSALQVESRRALISSDNYFNFKTDKDIPGMDRIKNTYMGYLDIQWGRFMATGSEKPVRNIISVLEFARYLGSQKKYPHPQTDEEKDCVIKEILFQTAVWSLRGNFQMHPKVLEICKKVYGEKVLNSHAQAALQGLLILFETDKNK